MLEPRTLSVAKKAVEAAVPAAISYGCGRHARHYINFAISRHASGVAAFCFARNAKHDSAHHSLKSPACPAVSCSCTFKSRLTFSAKSCQRSLREKWTYADSDAVPQLSATSRLARPPTKTGFQSWLGNKSACVQAEYSFRFQWG